MMTLACMQDAGKCLCYFGGQIPRLARDLTCRSSCGGCLDGCRGYDCDRRASNLKGRLLASRGSACIDKTALMG